jgi:hypothetical protein
MMGLVRKHTYLRALISNLYMVIRNLLLDKTEPGSKSNQTSLSVNWIRIKLTHKQENT